MKYYAVTNDPNELAHYGRLGMKWGQHIFGGEKSSAYKRASSKLSKSMRNGIASKKTSWRKNPSPAVLKAKAEAKAAKQEARAFKKEQKFMNKAVQRAREGRLKYGKLTDDQVRRVTERLALEQRARQLGSTEKPKFKTRLKEAIQEGTINGISKGEAAYIEEQLRAKGKVKAQKKYGRKLAKAEAKNAGIRQARTKIANEKTIKAHAKQEEVKENIKTGAKNVGAKTWRATKRVSKKAVSAAKNAASRRGKTKNRRKSSSNIGPYAYELDRSEYTVR